MAEPGSGLSHQLPSWRTLLADPSASGELLRDLVARPDVPAEAAALLAADQLRLKQTPAIATAIYRNPAVPMSVANLALVTCHRAGVVPDGIVGFEELAAEIAGDQAALDPRLADVAFAEMLHSTGGAVGDDVGAGGVDSAGAIGAVAAQTEHRATDAEKIGAVKSGARRSAVIDFTRLKLYEKIRLATLGNAYCRQNLLRDSNRMVAMAVIRSPQMTDSEMAKAAGNRALSEEVIRYIGNRKELVKQYPVKLALVGNAKCPLAVALRLLSTLNADDIKQIARSKNVPGALSTAAKRLAAAKGPQ